MTSFTLVLFSIFTPWYLGGLIFRPTVQEQKVGGLVTAVVPRLLVDCTEYSVTVVGLV